MNSSEGDSDSGEDPENAPGSRDENSPSSRRVTEDTVSRQGDKRDVDAWEPVSSADPATEDDEPHTGGTLPVPLEELQPTAQDSGALPTEPEPEVLPTYNESIDPTFESGFVPGSILAVEGPPQSKSDVLVANLISGGNPVVYLSGVRSKAAIEVRLDELKTIPKDDRHIFDVSGWEMDELVTVLEELQLAQPSTVVIDPITLVEADADRDILVDVMRTLKDTIGNHSLGIVHCLTPVTSPPNRWVTLQLADTLFEVRHDPGRDAPNVLYINRLHPKQSFEGQGREFDLTGDLDLDLDYDESLSTPTG